ncbi:MAG: gluconolactonase [Opitutae bacterium]|nr:gluconolactonase [Opitutae bacterium]|tara:strand:- start:2096 stop:3022 length:927 start_codon:yes stop_codon:yes gene_type:complete
MNRVLLPLCIALVLQALSLQGASVVEPGAKVSKLAGGMKFTEGPVWLPQQNKVVFSDIPNSKLMQWSEKNGLSVFRKSEQANGNILDLQGRIISCQHAARNVIRIGKDGKATVLTEKFEGKRFNSPNDVAVWKDGTLWFTDPPWGLRGPHEIPGHWVYKLDPDTGKVEVLIKDLAMPNGIVFSPDGSRLYVADTGGNKRHPDPTFHKLPASITCYEVTKNGKLGKQLYKIKEGSDGMAVDVKGHLYTTHRHVHVYDVKGKKLETIEVPEGAANVCFGGKDYKTLFITARTSLYQVRVVHAGAVSLRNK